jgi:hypothetical protein
MGWAAEESGFDSRYGKDISIFSITSRSVVVSETMGAGRPSPGSKADGVRSLVPRLSYVCTEPHIFMAWYRIGWSAGDIVYSYAGGDSSNLGQHTDYTD